MRHLRQLLATEKLVQMPEAVQELRHANEALAEMTIRIVIGTGPSLAQQIAHIQRLQAQGAKLYGINNTFRDFELDTWIACDPAWHQHYGKIDLPGVRQVHWDEDIVDRFGYEFMPGEWLPGLSTDPGTISFGHSSGWQALNLASHDCDRGDFILLTGYDMTYRPGEARHYFGDLSEDVGEYPMPLRKFSKFDKGVGDGLLWDYQEIARQAQRGDVPPIYNCTLDSAMRWFPFYDLERDELVR